MKKTTFFILLMTVLLMILPMTALATTATVKYIDESGIEQSHDCIIMESGTDYTFENGKWYAVTKDVTIQNRIDNQASNENPAHLILTDGYSLTAKDGIKCETGKGLIIYGQSAGTGKLTATTNAPHSGIGGSGVNAGSGDITINGGAVNATGGNLYLSSTMNYMGYPGIGGSGANVTINGGTVTAGADSGGPGIGCGTIESGAVVTINGGTVIATGGMYGAGIGGGFYSGTATVTINGGTVTATGGEGADGIGTGADPEGGVNVTINDGEITATGATGNAGIGGNLSFSRKPAVKAGTDKDSATDVDADTYKTDHQNYQYVRLKHVPLTEIKITTPPTKTVYTEGQTFDPNGMVVTATYSDNSNKAVTGYTFSPDGALATTDTVVTVSYTEGSDTKTAEQTITVVPVTLTKIEITAAPDKTVYTEGESFDNTGMVVTATYSDNSSKAVTGYTISPSGALAATDTVVTVSYTEGSETKTAEQAITVNPVPVTLTKIEITTAPAKTVYTAGESFDSTGMVVTATYSDNSSKTVTGYASPPSGALATTDTAVTVSYTEGSDTKTATQAIAVNPVPITLTKIEITTPPSRTVYTEGESFDAAGMVVTAT